MDVNIHTKIVYSPFRNPLFGQRIAQSDVLQTDVRTVFNIAVANHIVVVRVGNCGAGDVCSGVSHAYIASIGIPITTWCISLRRVDGFQPGAFGNVFQLIAPQAVHVGELHFHVVVHLVAVGSVNKYVEVEVLVVESVGPSEGEFGHGRPDVGLVVVVDLAVGLTLWTADIFEFQVANPWGCVAVEALSVSRIF